MDTKFITLHQLSVQLNVSVRKIRYHLNRLILEQKLHEGQDYRRDDYRDENHFTWMLNPESFVRASGLIPVAKPSTKPLTMVNQAQPVVDQTVNRVGNQVVNEARPVATNIGNERADERKPLADRKPGWTDYLPPLAREMIEILKAQLTTKDRQSADLMEQNKSLSSMNLKLTGQLVLKGDKIENLLRLTGGKIDLSEVETKVAPASVTKPSTVVTHSADTSAPVGDETADVGQPTVTPSSAVANQTVNDGQPSDDDFAYGWTDLGDQYRADETRFDYDGRSDR